MTVQWPFAGSDTVTQADLEDREKFLLHLINSQWREIVWLRGLLGLTGFALLLVTLAVALR